MLCSAAKKRVKRAVSIKYVIVVQSLSYVLLFATLWTIACQAPLSVEFSRQEYWSQVPFFFVQGIFPTQGLNLDLLHLQVHSLSLSHLGSPCKIPFKDLV